MSNPADIESINITHTVLGSEVNFELLDEDSELLAKINLHEREIREIKEQISELENFIETDPDLDATGKAEIRTNEIEPLEAQIKELQGELEGLELQKKSPDYSRNLIKGVLPYFGQILGTKGLSPEDIIITGKVEVSRGISGTSYDLKISYKSKEDSQQTRTALVTLETNVGDLGGERISHTDSLRHLLIYKGESIQYLGSKEFLLKKAEEEKMSLSSYVKSLGGNDKNLVEMQIPLL